MKILCVIDSLGSGGAQRQLVELALGFKEKGHDVAFLIYHDIVFYKEILEISGIPITCLHKKSYLVRILLMRRFIRNGEYDAVISFLEGSNIICELAGIPSRKWKLIVGERSANPNVLKSIKLRVYRWFHILADYVVANSNANMQVVRAINPLLSESKCKVIYNAVDFEKNCPVTDYIPRKSGKLKLIVIASHQYLKNLNGLLDALKLLDISDRLKLKVEWYGDRLTEPYYDNSIKESKQKIQDYNLNDVIELLPATKNITRKIQEADIVGLFSFYEGFPNSVCEGMACGKPVICSAVSDIPSILSYDLNLLFNPNDCQSINNAIKYILNLDNNQLIYLGSQNAINARIIFEKQSIVNHYLGLCKH